jgi:sterol desaturase/sphingolipid hydroxylase (fatty acid hydroxylase superfamily)
MDKAIGFVFVSPNMHKVHHHWQQPYTDSNYGLIFSTWDRALGTYSELDPSKIRYGLDRYYPNEEDENFMLLMKKPFRKMGAPSSAPAGEEFHTQTQPKQNALSDI